MNAMNGVDNKRASKWIAEQNLDRDIADHLRLIIDKLANNQLNQESINLLSFSN